MRSPKSAPIVEAHIGIGLGRGLDPGQRGSARERSSDDSEANRDAARFGHARDEPESVVAPNFYAQPESGSL